MSIKDLNIQIIFDLDERHRLKAAVLESGKKSINWFSVGNFETLSLPYRQTYSL